MAYHYAQIKSKVHRIIPSRFPTISLFDWANSPEELEQLAALEGLTNDRLNTEYGKIHLVAKEDWCHGEGTTPLMAAFTHAGHSRFADGTYGVYYAANSLETAIAETKFHRERFLNASKEQPCLIQMREYTAVVKKEVVDISNKKYRYLLNPDPNSYLESQNFGREIKSNNEWGITYPSVRDKNGHCVAIFRPPALSTPIQGKHLNYVWDGHAISDIRLSKSLTSA